MKFDFEGFSPFFPSEFRSRFISETDSPKVLATSATLLCSAVPRGATGVRCCEVPHLYIRHNQNRKTIVSQTTAIFSTNRMVDLIVTVGQIDNAIGTIALLYVQST